MSNFLLLWNGAFDSQLPTYNYLLTDDCSRIICRLPSGETH